MIEAKRLGLGCNGMNFSNRQRSIETVHYALDKGITLFNTGDFYGGGESEQVLGEALKGVPRDKYFLSVKFGTLPLPGGGIYGLDMNPFHIKSYLTYSLHRLGVDYIDLYQPSRMDEAVPVEEVMGVLEDCVKEGYIRSIGLTQVSADNLKQAAKVTPIKMLEEEYSLSNRSIEKNGVLKTARENKIPVLAFGVLAHGVLSDTPARTASKEKITSYQPQFAAGSKQELLSGLRSIAAEKNTTVEKLAQAYVLAKNPDMRILIGTTRKEHLQDSLNALSVELTPEDIQRIEAAFPAEKFQSANMPAFIFRNGRVVKG